MDLKKRLAQFDRSTQGPRPGDPAPRLGSNEGSTPNPSPTAEQIAENCRDLGLQEYPTPHGPVWWRQYPPAPETEPPEPLPNFTAIFTQPAPARLRAGEILFLDTETTGLVGGTGCLAFLVGLAWWTGDGLQIRQLFLPGPGREGPLLAELAERAREFRTVVTYNGNVFDLPLLRTRSLLARRANPLGHLVSWDLLPAVRRLWGRRLPDCRQQTLETEACGLERGPGDIEGSRIPQVYFQFLREGKTELLPSILRHNRRDMVGMAALFSAVAHRADSLASPGHGRTGNRAPIWQDAWSNSRILEARREPADAAAWMRSAWRECGLEGTKTDPVPPENFGKDAIRILKRVQAWELVERILCSGLHSWGGRPWIHREAAVLYEHRLAQLEKARFYARKLGDEVRLLRLERKLSRNR